MGRWQGVEGQAIGTFRIVFDMARLAVIFPRKPWAPPRDMAARFFARATMEQLDLAIRDLVDANPWIVGDT